MALIKCPECGKEISDTATACINCGYRLKGNTQKVLSTSVKSVDKKKATAIIATIVIIALFITGALLLSQSLSEDEQLAYDNCLYMQTILNDPDSFTLYDDMKLLKIYDSSDNNTLKYTYTLFKYGAKNAYGAMVTDEAIFIDDDYFCNYSELDTEDSLDSPYEKVDKALVKLDIDVCRDEDFSEENWFEWVDINSSKIKHKLKLK